jgi:hypothetical protein
MGVAVSVGSAVAVGRGVWVGAGVSVGSGVTVLVGMGVWVAVGAAMVSVAIAVGVFGTTWQAESSHIMQKNNVTRVVQVERGKAMFLMLSMIDSLRKVGLFGSWRGSYHILGCCALTV